MQAGKLRSRLTISRGTKTQNSFGEDVITWVSLGEFWAEILPLQGRELEVMQQRWAEARFTVRIRFQPTITFRREDRGTWGSRTLDILDVEDIDQRQRELRLICREYTQ